MGFILVYSQHIHPIVAIFWDQEQTPHQNLVVKRELVRSTPPAHLLPLHWLLMPKSVVVFITHSRTWCDLGKREASCTWYICVLFHRWEEWWMDEVHSYCNGTLVYHGSGGRKEVFGKKKNQIRPLQSGLPKWIPDNISLLWFHDKLPVCGGWVGVNMRTESWRLWRGHHMWRHKGILLFYKEPKEQNSAFLTPDSFRKTGSHGLMAQNL